MDLTETVIPASEQLDACELVTPRTFTIERVSKGNAEQPVNLHLVDFPRPWRPGKSMRRVLIACWGPDASRYVGRRVRLYCDDSVVFGGAAVGGTRIESLSHIDKPKKIPLLVSRGRSAVFVVKPLADDAPAKAPDVSWPDKIALATSRDDLATIRDQARTAGANGREIDKLLTDRARELGIAKAAAETTSDEPA